MKGRMLILAWPDTLVVNEGKWYDKLAKRLKLLKGEHYKVGHAAFCLLKEGEAEILYYDFGRYITPYQKGRVRSKRTDFEVNVAVSAKWNGEKLANKEEIIHYLSNQDFTHGDGRLCASWLPIDFEKAKHRADYWQDLGIVNYGPFELKGTNCSRFVYDVAKRSCTKILHPRVNAIPYTITPSPMYNVRMWNNESFYCEFYNGKLTYKKRFDFRFKGLTERKRQFAST